MVLEYDAELHALLKAAQAIEEAATGRRLSFREAEAIAERHGAHDFGIVIGHLALTETCVINYAEGWIECRKEQRRSHA